MNVEAFLTLVRMGVGHSTEIIAQPLEWSEIKSLAMRQGLYAIVLDSIDQLPKTQRPPKDLALPWIGEVMQGYEYRYEQYCRSISGLASFYRENGFKMMVLKGYVCSLDWPKPAHRPCGDIDIWQFGEQIDADAAIASKKGIKIDYSQHHHTVFMWQDFSVENHYDFINVHHHKSNVELEKVFKELGKDELHYVDVYGERIYLPSPNLHALFLLKHSMSDFTSSSVTLRQLLDWGFHVQNHGEKIDWEWLFDILNKYHMVDYFNIVNAICVENLGFESNMFPYTQVNPFLKDKVINDIFYPKYERKEPALIITRLIYKYKRWKANRWKHELCYNESIWSAFWSGIWNHLLKPSSF